MFEAKAFPRGTSNGIAVAFNSNSAPTVSIKAVGWSAVSCYAIFAGLHTAAHSFGTG